MANNKVSPITLQSNDVATLGSQGNSIIAHNNGLTSIRAAGANDSAAVDPFNDDCSGIYASPGGISLNTKSTQTNYQTIGSTQTQQNNPENIVQANVPVPSVSVTLPVQAPKPSILPTPSPSPSPSTANEFEDIMFLPEREDSPITVFSPFSVDVIEYKLEDEVGKESGILLEEQNIVAVNLEDFKTLPSKITNNKNFKKFISTAGVKEKVESITKKLGVGFNDLIVIMNAESAGTFNPSVKNPTGGATGLIQFMPSTAKYLGTTTDALSKMTILQQLDYVEKFFLSYKMKLKNVYDLYGVTFFPVLVGKPQTWIIQSKQHSAAIVSQQNPAIARAAGKTPGTALTVADFYKYVSKILK